MSKRDPHIAIMLAAARGVGIRLTAGEVAELASNDGVGLIARNIMHEAGTPGLPVTVARGHTDWLRADPRKMRLRRKV